MELRSKSWFAALGASIVIALIYGGMAVVRQKPAETKTVTLGYFPNITHTQAIVGIQRGDFQKALGGIKIVPAIFNAGPEEIEALFAGQVDIGYIGPSPAVNGYIKSQGKALRVIAGATSGGASLVVRQGSGINKPEDLKGKKIASPQLGNTQDIALRHYLQETLNLTLAEKGGDTRVIPIKNPDILALFKKGDLDAAWVPEPWATRLVKEGSGKILIDERNLWPSQKFSAAVLIARKEFLDTNPDLVKKLLHAHISITKWANEHPQQTRKIVRDELKRITGKWLPEDTIRQAYTRMSITWEPLDKTIAEYARWSYDLGFLGKNEPALEQLCDTRILRQTLTEGKMVSTDK